MKLWKVKYSYHNICRLMMKYEWNIKFEKYVKINLTTIIKGKQQIVLYKNNI